jgi:hypothetical protein
MLHTALRGGLLASARKQLLFCAGNRRLAGDRVPIEYRPIIEVLEAFADRPDLPTLERGRLFFDHCFYWPHDRVLSEVAKRHVALREMFDAIMERHLAAEGILERGYYEGYPGFEQDESMFYSVTGHVFAAHESSATGLAQADLLRDILGNPFHPVALPTLWRTDTVSLMAKQIHDSREYSVMPILADALQDAGCDNDDILSHCRGTGRHFRGCWVCDLVLGKS